MCVQDCGLGGLERARGGCLYARVEMGVCFGKVDGGVSGGEPVEED
jgi:hypothetical protein